MKNKFKVGDIVVFKKNNFNNLYVITDQDSIKIINKKPHFVQECYVKGMLFGVGFKYWAKSTELRHANDSDYIKAISSRLKQHLIENYAEII